MTWEGAGSKARGKIPERENSSQPKTNNSGTIARSMRL